MDTALLKADALDDADADALRCDDLGMLAPAMRRAVEAALADCHHAGLDAVVWETSRTQALQSLYFARGATRARDVMQAWHFYGLAVDVISASRRWSVTPAWRAGVTTIFRRHGMSWGGDWLTFRDEPHYTWGRCRPSPSARARELYHDGGLAAVWAAVGAA